MSRGVSTAKRNPREIPAGDEGTFILARNGEQARRSPEWFVASVAEGGRRRAGRAINKHGPNHDHERNIHTTGLFNGRRSDPH